jgi:hypothetical protein
VEPVVENQQIPFEVYIFIKSHGLIPDWPQVCDRKTEAELQDWASPLTFTKII